MRIKMDAVVAAMLGTTKNSSLVFVHNPETGAVYARAKSRPRDPKTYEQRCARDVQRGAAKVWAALTDSEREGWHAFAQFVSIDGRKRRALDVCRESARMRLMLGLQPCTAPPTRSYPERVREVTVEPSTEAGELRLRVVHAAGSPDGTMLQVRMTPEMKPGVTPRPAMARAICGPGAQSAVPLPESGGIVTFTGVQFTVAAGRHFGVDVRIVRAEDGLASPSSFFDLVMPAPTTIEPPQGTGVCRPGLVANRPALVRGGAPVHAGDVSGLQPSIPNGDGNPALRAGLVYHAPLALEPGVFACGCPGEASVRRRSARAESRIDIPVCPVAPGANRSAVRVGQECPTYVQIGTRKDVGWASTPARGRLSGQESSLDRGPLHGGFGRSGELEHVVRRMLQRASKTLGHAPQKNALRRLGTAMGASCTV